ncbi:MAG: hypothetical protein KIT33_08345 [Candidatus Kapabacteria bacterium]|nr:hypothetical protein [Ignavibacteriota bacterium]MCW5884964.1 hypothetical protein [Candidatus Kapabacteria bacterium]
MKFFADFKFIILVLLSVSMIISCSETEKVIEDETDNSNAEVSKFDGDFTKSIIPSTIAYFNEVKGGLSRVISFEEKSDSKSKYVSFVMETTKGEIFQANVHYEGEYNQSELTALHPFIVICESDDDCKNCGFQTTEEGTMCGCNTPGSESPCVLSIDHVTDYNFYINYHDLGMDLLDLLN